MGMNGCKYIAGSLEGNHIEMLCRHIEYEVEKIGPEHVGFGLTCAILMTGPKPVWKFIAPVWAPRLICLLRQIWFMHPMTETVRTLWLLKRGSQCAKG